jgi:hypothetical protein
MSNVTPIGGAADMRLRRLSLLAQMVLGYISEQDSALSSSARMAAGLFHLCNLTGVSHHDSGGALLPWHELHRLLEPDKHALRRKEAGS